MRLVCVCLISFLVLIIFVDLGILEVGVMMLFVELSIWFLGVVMFRMGVNVLGI